MVIILVEKREMNSKPRVIKKIVLDELLTSQQKSQRDFSHCSCDSTYYQAVFFNVNVLKQLILKLPNSLVNPNGTEYCVQLCLFPRLRDGTVVIYYLLLPF